MAKMENLTDGQKISVLHDEFLEQDLMVKKHHKILVEGNGELPLIERVRNIERTLGRVDKWFTFIAQALIAQTVTFAVAAIIYFIKLYPILEALSKNQP